MENEQSGSVICLVSEIIAGDIITIDDEPLVIMSVYPPEGAFKRTEIRYRHLGCAPVHTMYAHEAMPVNRITNLGVLA